VAIDGGAPRAHVALELGWWPRRTPISTRAVDLDDDGAASVTIDRFGCGEVWLHALAPARCQATPVRTRFAAATSNALECHLEPNEQQP
jgi:hypothetical protein